MVSLVTTCSIKRLILRMISETESIKSQPSPADATKALYENRASHATVTVDDGGEVIVAEFDGSTGHTSHHLL